MGNKVTTDNNDKFEQELEAYMEHMNQELAYAEALIQDMKNAPGEKNPYYGQLSKYINSNIERGLFQNTLEWAKAWEMWHDPSLISYWKKADPNLTNKNDPFVFNQDPYGKHSRLQFAVTNWNNINTENFLSRFGGEICKDAKDGQTVCAILEDLQYFDLKVKNDEQALQAIDPNINLTLVNQLNNLLAQSDDLACDHLLQDDLNRAIQQFTVIFSHLCDALMDTIRADLANDGMKKFASSDDPRAAAAIMQFASIAIQAQFDELSSVQTIQNLAIDDLQGWQEEKSNAQADLDKPSNAFFDFFTGGNSQAGKDRAQIRAADAMISLLIDVEKDISPLMSIDPGMQQFQIELDELKKKFQAFLSGHGTLQEIKDAMVEALSILVGIIAETEKDSSVFDKEMNKGSMASSQMHLNDSLSQEQTIIAAKKYAAIMETLLKAAQYIGMGAIFLMNPGLGMAVMVAIDAALTASGVMDKLQAALTDKLGTIGGLAMFCAIEMVATAGGAAAIDKGIEMLAENAMTLTSEAAETAAKETIEEAVESTVKPIANSARDAAEAAARVGRATEEEVLQAGQKAFDQAMKAGREVIEKAVNDAQEIAARKVTCVYLNKSVTQIGSFSKANMKVAMETAQKQAAKTAAKEVETLAETATKKGSAAVVGEKEIESIAKTSANRGVAEACKITEKSASKVDQMWLVGERTAVKKALVRGTFAGLAAMGRTDFLMDVTAAWQHKDKQDLNEGWQISMQVIQALMAFIGMIGESDIAPESIMSTGVLNKFLLVGQTAQGGLQAVGDAGVAEANFTEAGAIKGIAKDQSVLDMMQFIMSQLRKDGQIQRDQYSKEMQQASKSNMALGMHFSDANQEIAQALAVLPV